MRPKKSAFPKSMGKNQVLGLDFCMSGNIGFLDDGIEIN